MDDAVRVTVTLEPDIQDFVRDEIRRGAFSSASDYIETVLRQRQERELARKRLDAEIQKGLDDIQAGRVLPLDEAFAEVRQRLGITKSAQE